MNAILFKKVKDLLVFGYIRLLQFDKEAVALVHAPGETLKMWENVVNYLHIL